MSTDLRYPEQPSFLDCYADHKGWEHVNLARPGASNFCIHLQIERAIKDKADYVIVGATSSDRIEVADVNYKQRLPIRLDLVHYTGYHAASEAHVDNANACMISDTLNNVIEHEYQDIDSAKKQSVKMYLRDLHNFDIEDQRNYYIVRDGLRDLVQSRIPYLFIPGPLFFFDWQEFEPNVWKGPQPWDMPDGIGTRVINHNPPAAHQKFYELLIQQTQNWY
jgi:hypothetical protein